MTGPPGHHSGVKRGIGVVQQLNFHIRGCVNVMLADVRVLCSQEVKARPRNATWRNEEKMTLLPSGQESKRHMFKLGLAGFCCSGTNRLSRLFFLTRFMADVHVCCAGRSAFTAKLLLNSCFCASNPQTGEGFQQLCSAAKVQLPGLQRGSPAQTYFQTWRGC